VLKETIVLVDSDGKQIGTAEKLASHHAQTPLHLAFSCYIFDASGRLLVTRRASAKKVWPGVWTNSVCGHPAPGETTIAAIQRRLDYELGMSGRHIALAVPKYIYKTPPFKGVVEHEYCPIYLARSAGRPQPNHDEVDDYQWLAWLDYLEQIAQDKGDKWSWWCKDQARLLRNHPLVIAYSVSE